MNKAGLKKAGLPKTLICSVVLVAASVTTLSCGSGSSNKTGSGLSYRAFISNPLHAGSAPVLEVVNAQTDALPGFTVSLLGELTQPQMMVLSPNRRYTWVYSPVGTQVALVDNTTEGIATNGNGGSASAITLPGSSESMFISTDNATGYAAVPSAPTPSGQAPGAVVQLDLLNGDISASIPVPSAHYVVQSNNGNLILVFSDNSNAITMISPILVGTNGYTPTLLQSPNLDRPIGAIFSADDSVAYIFNCGPECGGTQASIAMLQVGANTITSTIPLGGATAGLLNGTTLYVAGSPPGTACGSGTAATSCGTLNMIDTSSFTLMNSTPILITDGRHNHLELTADGQLYIGAHTCSNVNILGGEVRGCLSIFNTAASTVVIPAFAGDVTGIAPILGRHIVYVIQNAELNIFDTTTNQIEVQNNPGPIDIVGQPYDVKYVDPAVPN